MRASPGSGQLSSSSTQLNSTQIWDMGMGLGVSIWGMWTGGVTSVLERGRVLLTVPKAEPLPIHHFYNANSYEKGNRKHKLNF